MPEPAGLVIGEETLDIGPCRQQCGVEITVAGLLAAGSRRPATPGEKISLIAALIFSLSFCYSIRSEGLIYGILVLAVLAASSALKRSKKPNKDLLTIEEAAIYANVSERTIRSWLMFLIE